jgi:hypothetical protein
MYIKEITGIKKMGTIPKDPVTKKGKLNGLPFF